MIGEIAVFTGTDGRTASLTAPGQVTVYRRQQRMWAAQRKQEVDLATAGGLKELRRRLAELVAFLGGCNVFVAGPVTGVPFYELEKAGVSVWEVSGDPRGSLDEIWERDQAARGEESKPVAMARPEPVEVAPGRFAFSVKELQEKECGITSKQALQPFLRQRRFAVLEVVCNHLPPWLEGELAGGGFAWEAEKVSEKEVRLTIRRLTG